MAGCMGKYQAIILDNPDITLWTTSTLNSAILLPISEEGSDVQHGCLKITDKVYSGRPDQLDQLLTEPDWEFYTDGSSFMENGQQ